MIKPGFMFGTLLAGALAVSPAVAAPVPLGDRTFMKAAAQAGMAEVELGKLAQEKAQSSDVKGFGQMMVDDHTKAGDELKGLAGTKNVTLPTAMDPAHKATHARLAKLSGDAFDRAYMAAMVKDHKKAVADFTHESKMGKDAETKDWAGKTLPTLEAHLKRAQELAGTATTMKK
jgi:putative membrane protein